MANRPPSSSENQPIPGSENSDLEPTIPPNSDAVGDELPTMAPGSSGTGTRAETGHENSFADYELLEEIARGGMGVVYRARQKSLDRIVALKMILSGQLASEEEVRRFYAEAHAAAKLDHNHIVPIFEIGEENDTHFFSMKLIEGSHLGNEIGSLRNDLDRGIALLEKVCRAVHHAHQRGILHRDLKPGNILIDESGEPFVVDLGLARSVGGQSDLTRTGAIVGTPSYMPPEQAAGDGDITTSADIYSLGAILYELLTGKPPFRGSTPMETLLQVIEGQVERPSMSGMVDRELEMVALKCLAKDPRERYSTADDLADDLHRWLAGEPVTVRAPSFTTLFKNWMRQNFGRAGYILVVGAVGGVVAGTAFWSSTVQTGIEQKLDVYSQMASVDAPFSLLNWNMPPLLAVVCLMLFTGVMALLGYFTALLTRTKNRSADLAAGILVGVIAAAGVFFTSLGTLAVISIDNDADVLRLGTIAKSSDGNYEEIFNVYPEFENWDREKQVNVLLNKITADRIYQIHYGILIGTICCLVLFLTAGVVETVIAGPIIRNHPKWWKSLPVYLFCSFPFVVGIVVFGLYTAGFLVTSSSAIIWSWVTIITFGVIILAVISEIKKWHLGFRVPINALMFLLFAFFCLFYFRLIPRVLSTRVMINETSRLVDKFPNNHKLKLRAAEARMNSGELLYRTLHFSNAAREYERAISTLNSIPVSESTAQRDELIAWAILGWARCKNSNDARSLLQESLVEHPQNLELRSKAIEFLVARRDFESANQLFDQFKIDGPESWRSIRAAAILIEREDRSKADRQSRIHKRLVTLVEASNLSPKMQQRLLRSCQPQHWKILAPVEIDSLGKAIGRLKNAKSIPDESPVDGATWRPANPLVQVIDLNELFPNAPPKRNSAFAVAFVDCEVAQTAKFHLGSDDGAKVWVNGKEVHVKLVSRPFQPREDQFEVELSPGNNLILIRIRQDGGDWQFSLEVEDLEGWPADVTWK